MYVFRENEKDFFSSFEGMFVSALPGPKGVGKTTLVEHYMAIYPERKWVKFNMDERKQRQRIANDELLLMIEESSLQKVWSGEKLWVVIEEAQKCPDIFDQIKLLYDKFKDADKIKFILTGSAHLNLYNLVAETLAGRVDLLRLREFNLRETARLLNKELNSLHDNAFSLIFNSHNIDLFQELNSHLRPFQKVLMSALELQLVWGGLPELLQIESEKERFKYLSNYLQTYLEKDIREISAINDLALYENIMKIM